MEPESEEDSDTKGVMGKAGGGKDFVYITPIFYVTFCLFSSCFPFRENLQELFKVPTFSAVQPCVSLWVSGCVREGLCVRSGVATHFPLLTGDLSDRQSFDAQLIESVGSRC